MQPNSPEIERLVDVMFSVDARKGWEDDRLAGHDVTLGQWTAAYTAAARQMPKRTEDQRAYAAAILADGYALRSDVIEECAKVADEKQAICAANALKPGGLPMTDKILAKFAHSIAAAIRGRASK